MNQTRLYLKTLNNSVPFNSLFLPNTLPKSWEQNTSKVGNKYFMKNTFKTQNVSVFLTIDQFKLEFPNKSVIHYDATRKEDHFNIKVYYTLAEADICSQN